MDKALLKKSLEKSPNERVAFAEMILASIDQENDDLKHVVIWAFAHLHRKPQYWKNRLK